MKAVFLFLSLSYCLISTSVAQDSLSQNVSNDQAKNIPDHQKVLSLYENQQFYEAAQYLESFYTDTTSDTKLINSIA